MTAITPTVGRVVWYIPHADDLDEGMIKHGEQPFKADVVYVWSDTLVNLTVTDHDGIAYTLAMVQLEQEGDSVPDAGGYCKWMPYQIGQAKKHAS